MGRGFTGEDGIFVVTATPDHAEIDGRKVFATNTANFALRLMRDAGLDVTKMYFTNICKCRMPNNREPEYEEIARCTPFLLLELKALKPSLILALGKIPAIALTGEDMHFRGDIVPLIYTDLHNCPVMILDSPYDIVKQRELIPLFSEFCKKINNPPPTFEEHYNFNPTPNEALAMFYKWQSHIEKTDGAIAIDIETQGILQKKDGLNPFRGQIIGIAFCGKEGEAFILHTNDPNSWPVIREIMESNTPKVFHNNLFDILFVLVKQNIKTKNLKWDTMDAMHVIYSDGDKDLDHLRAIYTNKKPYKHLYKRKGRVDHLSKDKLAYYACSDVDVTLRAMIGQRRTMDSKLYKVVERMLNYDRVATQMRLRGIKVDQAAVILNAVKYEPLMTEIEEEFITKYNTNINSPKQLAKLLFTEKGFDTALRYKKNESGLDTGTEVLERLLFKTDRPEDIELLTRLLKHRELSIAYKTFIKGIWNKIEIDGKLHPQWKVTGTDTGRWASAEPNLQNQPKDLRNQYIASEGNVLFVCDYSQLELVIGAIRAESKFLYDSIMNGVDVHELTRKELEKIFPGVSRTIAKNVNFGTMYGLTPATLASRLKIPRTLASELQSIVLKMFPEIKPYHERNIKFWKEHGYLESFFGRRKYCEKVTEVMNFDIQSTAFDVAGNALIALENAALNPILNVHDENTCEVELTRDTNSDFKRFVHIMQTSTPELSTTFPVEAYMATTWGDKKWTLPTQYSQA